MAQHLRPGAHLNDLIVFVNLALFFLAAMNWQVIQTKTGETVELNDIIGIMDLSDICER